MEKNRPTKMWLRNSSLSALMAIRCWYVTGMTTSTRSWNEKILTRCSSIVGAMYHSDLRIMSEHNE